MCIFSDDRLAVKLQQIAKTSVLAEEKQFEGKAINWNFSNQINRGYNERI